MSAWTFRVMRRLESGECEPATWPDGEPRYVVGLIRECVLAAAIREAEECAAAEPDAGFVVVDASAASMFELAPAGACPF